MEGSVSETGKGLSINGRLVLEEQTKVVVALASRFNL